VTSANPEAALLALTDLTTPHAMRVAVTLGLPSLIAEGVGTPAALAERTGAHPRALAGLVRYLVGKGVFAQSEAGPLALTPVGDLLKSRRAQLMLDLDEAGGHMSRAWAGLLPAVRSGEAGYPSVFGRGFWDTLETTPALAASFDAWMAGWAEQWVPDVVNGRDWSATGHVVDVGGGAGRLLGALLRATRTLRGTLVEQAGAASRARVALADVAERATVVEGSFFDALPRGGDVYLLAQVVHDWPDAHASLIMQRCAEAARPSGRVILVERLVDEARPNPDHARMDLLMLVMFGGAERTRAEFTALAAQSGLTLVDTKPIGHGLSFIECVPV